MAAQYEYKCSGCQRSTPREMLVVKKVLYTEMGEGSRTLRARVVGWFCAACTKEQNEWNLPPNRRPTERNAEVTRG